MVPGRGGPNSSPRSNRECGSTPLPSGASTTRRRVPRLSPAIKGPRASPLALNPPAPRLQGLPRGRPVLQPRPRLTPLHGRAPTPGRALLLPGERRNLAPTGAEQPRTPGGSLTMQGKPPGFPQAGRRALSRVEAVER
ncbi:hypothetical protein NDU88_004098 [Pleurodeles waltl]|uniref:Uncharacterized protein n=1 Tax=Pleurodeles waltl TaxID=8319 RepID=A0AAV7MXJ3_PLEWA|nr:hypothetical protein NDU88_004098 [Pleurodeles waltl]